MNYVGVVVVSALLGGCNFPRPGGDVAGNPDAMSDARVDDGAIDAPPGGCSKWVPVDDAVTDPCAAGLGTPADLTINANAVLNTITGELTMGGNTVTLPGGPLIDRAGFPSLRVVNLKSFLVDATRTLTFTGPNAVLFLVHGNATISGTINASAPLPTAIPPAVPGADSTRCDATRKGKDGMQSNANDRGGGGGGGGAFGDDGGDGGTGQGGINGGGKGSKDDGNVPLRGGCTGGRGGDDNNNGNGNQGGLPGGGGGAFAISALGTITVNGSLQANGGPGTAGTVPRGGGGGGGAGGTIALDGNTVALVNGSSLCAKGGGGGEASSTNTAGASAPTVPCNLARAPAGAGRSMTAGDGGVGGSTATSFGDDGANGDSIMGVEGGGGGAGGGAGRVVLRARMAGGLNNASLIVTPTPTVL